MRKNIDIASKGTNSETRDNTTLGDLPYRANLLELYCEGKITAAKIAILLNLKIRQVRRLIKNYREKGKLSLVHALSRKPSNHSIDAKIKEKALQLAREKYFDMSATLMSECFKKHDGFEINPFTLRLWLKENKLQSFKRKRKPYRTKRERKEYFGEMLQIDGSFHKWFTNEEDNNITMKEEDRKACLLNLIDDSTNTNLMLFDKQETMICACKLLWLWICRYGIPQSIYCDRRNMYVGTESKGNKGNREKSELNNPKGYFRTMTDNLNINIIEANSPQAKGRIERSNKTHQDRLVKLMRLKNIINIDEANKYLLNEYINEHNEKFSIPLQGNKITDMHRELEKNITLNDICYIEEQRKVSNDWTISYKGTTYQLKKQSQYHPPTKSTVYVRKDIENNVSIFYRNFSMKYSVIG